MIRQLFRRIVARFMDTAPPPRESAPEATVRRAGRRIHAEDPHAFYAVARRHKSARSGDRALDRSRYVPHQGVQECARRRQAL